MSALNGHGGAHGAYCIAAVGPLIKLLARILDYVIHALQYA